MHGLVLVQLHTTGESTRRGRVGLAGAVIPLQIEAEIAKRLCIQAPNLEVHLHREFNDGQIIDPSLVLAGGGGEATVMGTNAPGTPLEVVVA